MKKLLSSVIALILVCSLAPCAFAAAPAPDQSLLQPVNYWQDPGYAVAGVYAEDMEDSEYLYVFFENGEVVGLNSSFITSWLSCDAALSWQVQSNSKHIPLVSYAISVLLSGNDPWVAISAAPESHITLSDRIQIVPRTANTAELDGMTDLDEIFKAFLKREVDVYLIGAVELSVELDNWFILSSAEVMRWQPREVEDDLTRADYIYVPEWGVRFRVPRNLVASYTLNSQTNTLTITGTIAKSLQYLPEFASFDTNPGGLGTLVYLPDYDPDHSELHYGMLIEHDGKYFLYSHPQALFSTDAVEQEIEAKASSLIQQMLTENVESFSF